MPQLDVPVRVYPRPVLISTSLKAVCVCCPQLPELTSFAPRPGESPFVHFALKNFGMLLGFAIMLLIALYEDKIRFPGV